MMLAPRVVKRKTAAKPTAAATTATADKAVSEGEPAGANGEAEASSPAPHHGTPDLENQLEASTVMAATNVEASAESEAAEPIASTSQLQPDPEDQQRDILEMERLDTLRFTIEECLSDWGLSCQHPELLKKLEASETGFIHISNLLALPAISCRTAALTDITASLTGDPSETIELDVTGFQVRRRSQANYQALKNISVDEWAERTFYLENVPKPSKSTSYTLQTLRQFLSKLTDSSIDALRLPPLYKASHKDKDGSKGKDPTIEEGSVIGGIYTHEDGHMANASRELQFDAPHSETGKSKHQYAIPRNGGPFKGFAFVVVQDGDKARQAKEKWSWDSKGRRIAPEGEAAESHQQENEHDVKIEAGAGVSAESGVTESRNDQPDLATTSRSPSPSSSTAEEPATTASALDRTPEQLAHQSGLCIMPIEQFSSLRLEYLRYARDINTLREKQEALHQDDHSKRRQRRSVSPARTGKQRLSPSMNKWERKARSPSPERWERKPLSPTRNDRPVRRYDNFQDDDYPRGCVCFVKRFHPEARSGTLKNLFQAILETEEVSPKEHLQHVDHKKNVDSCHVRFTDASTASFLASYFSGNPKYSHVDPNSTDPSTAFAPVKKGDTARPIEAEVVTGIPEAIYWSTVPKVIKKAYGGSRKDHEAATQAAEKEGAVEVADDPAASVVSSVEPNEASEMARKRTREQLPEENECTEEKSSKQARVDVEQ